QAIRETKRTKTANNGSWRAATTPSGRWDLSILRKAQATARSVGRSFRSPPPLRRKISGSRSWMGRTASEVESTENLSGDTSVTLNPSSGKCFARARLRTAKPGAEACRSVNSLKNTILISHRRRDPNRCSIDEVGSLAYLRKERLQSREIRRARAGQPIW